MRESYILVADDDEGIREALTFALRTAGHKTVAVSDGIAALSASRQFPIKLAIIDLIMPKKEGIETILELRRERPDLAIIAISGGGCGSPEDYLNVAKKLGAVRTLTKPFTARELFAQVIEVLKSHPE
jgi:DNA-binding response OmpR family regulator